MSSTYPPEVKAAALADLAAGSSVSGTARKHGIKRQTLTMWRDQSDIARPSPARQEKKAALGEQLYGYLQDALTALRAQQRLFADPTWLARQPAGDLAILHGVITDKAIRLLGALRDDPNDPND